LKPRSRSTISSFWPVMALRWLEFSSCHQKPPTVYGAGRLSGR
jgi:hypothetical protein